MGERERREGGNQVKESETGVEQCVSMQSLSPSLTMVGVI